MPRYFFHVHDRYDRLDRTGTVLSGQMEAKREAVRLAGSLLAETPESLGDVEDWSLDVTDDRGTCFFSLHVSADERVRDAQSWPVPSRADGVELDGQEFLP